MFFELNFKSGVPTYQQIVDQVKHALATGVLHPGDQLPSIRALAETLRINRNTAAKAYSELEHAEIVKTEPGRGVFCLAADTQLTARARRKIIEQALDAVLVQAYHLNIDGADLLRLLEERLRALETRQQTSPRKEKETGS